MSGHVDDVIRAKKYHIKYNVTESLQSTVLIIF